MIGIDSNVLVRVLAADEGDEAQAAVARRLLAATREELHVGVVALAEAAWVLRSRYAAPRARIAAGLRAMLSHPKVTVASPEAVRGALDAYESGGAGFSDHLIGALNAAAGCSTTLTFDKGATKGPHFTLLE